MDTFSLAFEPQHNCMLFDKLPGEIRNEIIRLAVLKTEVIFPRVKSGHHRNGRRSYGRVEVEHPSMKTRKQLRRESAEIYFLENTFGLHTTSIFGPPRWTPPHVQTDANISSAATLVRSFGPYAPVASQLRLAHTFELGPFLTVQAMFKILRRTQPGSGVSVSNIFLRESLRPEAKICRCNIVDFAAEFKGDDIFEFLQACCRLMQAEVTDPRVVHCGDCGRERSRIA